MEQLFGAIPSVLKGLGANADVDEVIVFSAWSRCAGELLRTRTAPLEFFENRLVVAVQDETWRRHLEDLSPQMLVRINGSLKNGKVKFIEFRVDAKAVNAPQETKKDPAKDVPMDVTQSLTNAAEAIVDEKLREHFLSAAAVYLARREPKLEQ